MTDDPTPSAATVHDTGPDGAYRVNRAPAGRGFRWTWYHVHPSPPRGSGGHGRTRTLRAAVAAARRHHRTTAGGGRVVIDLPA